MYLDAARDTEMKILYAIDFHIHADRVSAGRRHAVSGSPGSTKYRIFRGFRA
jgi:hypothetical protein